MTIVRAQVRLRSITGDSADDAVNTLHFYTEGNPLFDPENVLDMLEDFYKEVDTHISLTLTTGDGTITLYDLSEPTPRVPLASREFTFGGSANEGLPPELAICLSYSAEPQSGVPRGRLRGRIYIPWLEIGAVDTGKVSDTVMASVAAAGESLLEAADASMTWDWVVFSPTRARDDEPPYDNSYSVTAKVWVDNAWDIQRSRGWKPDDRDERTL